MFPFEIKNVEEQLNKQLMDDFKGERNGFCQVGPKKWFLPVQYKDHADKYYNFKLREDDLWIVTYPRSGTTFTQELLWLVNNDCDFEKAKNTVLIERFPFFEFNVLHSKQFTDEIIELNGRKEEVIKELERRHIPGYVFGEEMASPRHLKTHLPLSLLPPKLLDTCKVVYVARNAKDVAISYFHHNRLFTAHDFSGDFDKYWDYFEKDLLLYSPYLDHIKEGWSQKDHPNLLFLFYEDLIYDLEGCIRKIAAFLNKSISDEQIEKLKKHLHIDNFRNVPIMKNVKIDGLVNSGAEGFIRRGKVGGNKEYATNADLDSRADKWVENNLPKTGVKFPMRN
ncbi:sulfotransferase 1C4-like [Cimex lectularius]|uniref:Sulfotransferase domain-containing protein n=1 Tax=Cimex lectularius TaxID=79782 RepID=A0A8I6SL70_CIMLE|nr:sulfotransferase 1C4-like [Cimex lectularius]XP_014244193.1 sulfotransferase 1C4-like [Cimex lectularius]XP_024083262.1 sulfotransferase 1C4-like [Cimex lectularius]XP_024083263.1 sulfotransferase 1C4-like [Cimex lectularius]